MKLRYSCSTLATAFEQGVAPVLRDAGITHARLPDGTALDLSGFRVHAVHFALAQRLTVELPYPAPLGLRRDVVEMEEYALVWAVVRGTLDPGDHPYCEWCFGDASLGRCSRCHGVHYCGRVC